MLSSESGLAGPAGIHIRGLRWWIVTLVFLATLISYIDRLTISVLAPVICADLHLSNLAYASVNTWFLLTYSLGQTSFGKLHDWIGTRRGFALAMSIWSLAEVAHAGARGLFSLSDTEAGFPSREVYIKGPRVKEAQTPPFSPTFPALGSRHKAASTTGARIDGRARVSRGSRASRANSIRGESVSASILPRLQERIQAFLSTIRVGIDFGEHFGGIAVVRGNEILHAETFLDFHEATLEQRRTLRRGRRSRHAKKVRLNRLRSWALRQKLPNGERLPDPHRVMRDPRNMPQPGVYKHKEIDPRTAPSWIELAKDGKTDAEGFVRALTLIFQKRGYKWDGNALEEMSDSKLKDFLQTARIPSNEPTLANDIRTQIERRRQFSDDPIRGKIKIKPEELEAFFQLACERGQRPPSPRQAEHRSVKEAELRAVVSGFAASCGMPAGQRRARRKQPAPRLLGGKRLAR